MPRQRTSRASLCRVLLVGPRDGTPTAIMAEDNLELLLPQIVWHDNRGAIQSVDTSAKLGLIATAGNDNEVRMWRLCKNGAVSFIQSLTGHTKVRTRGRSSRAIHSPP